MRPRMSWIRDAPDFNSLKHDRGRYRRAFAGRPGNSPRHTGIHRNPATSDVCTLLSDLTKLLTNLGQERGKYGHKISARAICGSVILVNADRLDSGSSPILEQPSHQLTSSGEYFRVWIFYSKSPSITT